jgi:electron transfer flavoprotein-quinone oxidoreductase
VSEDGFDAIIVGGGVAGTTSAYVMAKAGLQVLVVERGSFCGAKNMTGGRLYSHSLEKIIPNFAEEAPVERKVTKEKISMMTEDSAFTIDYTSEQLKSQGKDSYVILRGSFDRWLAEKAEEAGAMFACGIRVDDLLIRDAKVCGIIAGEDEIEANVVLLADGVNSLLTQRLGYCGELRPDQVAVGAKEVIELPESVIQDRFNCQGDEGTAWLFAGSPSDGKIGGGFLYTNKNSISLGVVSTLSDLIKADKSIAQMLEDFKQHAIIAPLIKDGKLIEYSGHLVPEGGYNMIPKIIGNGVLVVGDAAGFCINIGYVVRGLDLAIASAECAAKAVIEAKKSENYSESFLQCYQSFLDESFVMQDLKHYKKFPYFLEGCPRIFDGYPQMIENIMSDLFVVSGQPANPLMKNLLKHLKKVGIMNIAKDAWKGVRSL